MSSDTLLDTGHSGSVVDISANENGKLVATASSDGSVGIFFCSAPAEHEGKAASWKPLNTLRPEEGAGAVNCVAWAPLAFYSAAVLVCTNDNNKVYLFSDFSQQNQFEPVYENVLPAPGWCASWSPADYGKLFAVGCADGSIVVFTGNGPQWELHTFAAHRGGVSGLSFAPFTPPGALMVAPLEPQEGPPMAIHPPRLVSCGGGRHLKVWEHAFRPTDGGGPPVSVWNVHEPAIPISATWTVVAWAPSVGLPFTYIAAGSEEGHVMVWSQDGPSSTEWRAVLVHQMPDAVSAVSWSQTGTLLLASSVDGTAMMFKETAASWERLSDISKPTF